MIGWWKSRKARLAAKMDAQRIEAKLQLSRSHYSRVITPELIDACIDAFREGQITRARQDRLQELQ